MQAEGGAVSAFVAEIVYVDDLPCLLHLEGFLADDHQVAILAGDQGQGQAQRRDFVGVVGPVGADLDALVAEGGALEAAGRLGASTFLVQRLLNAGEPGPLSDGQHLGLVLDDLARPHLLDLEDVVRRQFRQTREGRLELDGKLLADRLRRPAAVLAGGDDDLRAAGDIAAGIDALMIRDSGFGIRNDPAVAVEREGGAIEEGQVRFLTDSEDDGRGLDPELAARDGQRPAPAVGTGLAQLVAHALQRSDPAILQDDARGRGQFDQLVALFKQPLQFLRLGGHLGQAAAVDDGGWATGQALGCARRIHGRVAAADNQYLLAESGFLTTHHRFQEAKRGIYLLALDAGDVQPGVALEAGGQVYSVKALLQ